MSLLSWLNGFAAGRRRERFGGRSQRRRPRRLSVERLEHRLTPSAGALDPSFGTGGQVNIAFTDPVGFPNPSGAKAVALQTDGKMIAVGSGHSTGDTDFVLARYKADGTLDTSFGTDGTAITDLGGSDVPHGVALQADGKIIVVGETFFGFTSDFALARYNPNGSLDLSFGPGGTVTTDFADGIDYGFSAVIQADGKIVVAGYAQGDHFLEFALVRYNSNGSLDTSFDVDGKVNTPFAGLDNDGAFDLVIQADGKIVAAGGAHVGADGNAALDFALVRYLADGAIDTSFGTEGMVTTDFAGGDLAHSVALQANGKIVAAGVTDDGGSRFALARYNADGSLDTTFDTDGKVITDFAGEFGGANEVALQADGKIIAVGSAGSINAFDFALAQYNIDGSLNAGFGSGGLVTTDFDGRDDGAGGVAIQPDGKLVVVGSTRTSGSLNFALARYEGFAPEIDVVFGGADLAGNSTVAYGGTPQGTPVSKTFIIRNAGSLNLTVSSVTVPSGYQLTTATLFPLFVAPGGQARLSVQLTAGTAGVFSGRVSIVNNDSNQNPFVINVTGTVLAPTREIQVLNGTADLADNTGVVNFGTLTLGGKTATRTFTVQNIGNSNLTLGPGITVPFGFSLASGLGSTTLTPGASTSFAVRLNTNIQGTFSGQVSFATNDSDENPFKFIVTGAVGGTSSPPMIRDDSLTPQVDEGGVATLRGRLVDPDRLDELFLRVDWGDGTPPETRAVGRTPFALKHRYLDDAPGSTPADEYRVHLTWFDSGGGSNSKALPVTVHNVAPEVRAGPPAFVKAGAAFERVGSFADPGLDSWYATVDYGDGRGPQWLALGPEGRFTLSQRYARPGVYPVRVRIFDDDGGVGSATLFVTVHSVPGPRLLLGGAEVIRAGEVMRHTGRISDRGAWSEKVSGPFSEAELPGKICSASSASTKGPDTFSDPWTATVDYGDGSGVQPLAIQPGRKLSFEHRYAKPGKYRVTVTALDQDGGAATDTFLVIVLGRTAL